MLLVSSKLFDNFKNVEFFQLQLPNFVMELPDLSHLTSEEQEQILSVIKRHQEEENKEKALIK